MDIDALHPVIFIVSFIGIIMGTVWMAHNTRHWAYGILPMTYFMHVFIYNIYLNFTLIGIDNLEIWSSAVRLHALFTFMVLFIFMPPPRSR